MMGYSDPVCVTEKPVGKPAHKLGDDYTVSGKVADKIREHCFLRVVLWF